MLGFVVDRRRLPRPRRRRRPARSSTSSSEPQTSRALHVSLVRRQHLFRAREQGQAEPRAPRRLAGPEARRAPGRRADRDRVRDEGQPEGLGREAHDARLRAREHGAQRGLLGARQGHARRHRLRRRVQRAGAADPGRGRPPAAPRGRAEGRAPRRSSRSASRSRSSPARCRTSPARSPRSTRTRSSSRCLCRSSAARRRSRSASTRSRRSSAAAHSLYSAKAHGQEGPHTDQAAGRRRPAPARRRRSAPRWASTASTSWSSARRSTPRRRTTRGTTIPVVITVYEDRSFTFVTKTPPAAVLIKQAIGIDKGSGEPHREKVGTDHPGPAARDRREEAPRPERQRRRPGREDHRRHRPLDGRGGGRRWPSTARPTSRRARKVDREREYAPAEAIALDQGAASAPKFDESVEVHVRTGLNVRHADEQLRGTIALPQRPRQGGHDRRLRPGRQGARGRGGRRRHRRRRGPRQARRGGLHRLRRRDRDAGPDAGRRPPRPHPRPAGQDAQPEGRHGDDGRRQGRRGVQGRQGRVPHRPHRDRPPRDRQDELRRARSCSRTTPRSSTSSSAPSRPPRRAATSGRSRWPRRWAPASRSTRPVPATSSRGAAPRRQPERSLEATADPGRAATRRGSPARRHMNREQKAAVIEEIADRDQGVRGGLRRRLPRDQRPAGRRAARASCATPTRRFRVVKNTLTERAADEAGAEALKALLDGPTALTFVRGDAAAAAKAIVDFDRDDAAARRSRAACMNGEPLDVDADPGDRQAARRATCSTASSWASSPRRSPAWSAASTA